jgi:hypothetical protein
MECNPFFWALVISSGLISSSVPMDDATAHHYAVTTKLLRWQNQLCITQP